MPSKDALGTLLDHSLRIYPCNKNWAPCSCTKALRLAICIVGLDFLGSSARTSSCPFLNGLFLGSFQERKRPINLRRGNAPLTLIRAPHHGGKAPLKRPIKRSMILSAHHRSRSQIASDLRSQSITDTSIARIPAQRAVLSYPLAIQFGIVQKVFSPKGVPRIFDAFLTQF